MIIHVKKEIDQSIINEIIQKYDAFCFANENEYVVITSSSVKEIDAKFSNYVSESFVFETDIQLASKKYIPITRKVRLSNEIEIGGDTNNTVMIAGPCSVESEEQINQVAAFINQLGVKVLRGGAYKPRTSPYTFKGLGLNGIKLLKQAGSKLNMPVITEARDSTHINDVIEHTDIIQVGAKAMYDHGILNACGNSRKPVLLKRGFGTTLQEFVQAAEFILSLGNPNVMLCERGIRTFETKTRFTLDLCGVAYLKEYTNLPVVLDTSHAMGYAYGVPDLTRACTAMGIDGLIIETHPNPKVAKSDASQQLNLEEFEKMYHSLQPIAAAVGRKIV